MVFLQNDYISGAWRGLFATVLCLASTAPAAPAAEAILPPELPWEGASRSLMVAADDPWVTPSELSGLTRTPSYEETFAWVDRLVAASPELEKVSVGRSHEGRELWMIVASRERAFTPEALQATGKPILLAHSGIHPGEIDGKDAGLMLLRDMTVKGTKADVLDGAHFLFLPILNVDGHERSSPHGRINQRGPAEMGWRTNSRNQNLNRDFTKLDTPEVRALVEMIHRWQPDLYLDLHVTDGADYQYDITFGFNGSHAHSGEIGGWLENQLRPALTRDLEAAGHVPGPLIFLADQRDPGRGLYEWTAPPRFSNGYGDARHLPTLLVENHSLKPYDQRVLGTYVLLESALRTLAASAGELRRAVAEDRSQRPAAIPIGWKVPETEPPTLEFLGVGSRLEPSAVSGGVHLEWTGVPVTLRIPRLQAIEPTATVARPRAYWVPAAWPEVIERLAAHGIRMERIDHWREVEVGMFRIEDAEVDADPYEGHNRVQGTPSLEHRTERFPPGSVRISTDQPLGTLAVLLLDPAAPDSFFRWGFFLEVLQRTEYVEEYVMEPTARRMLEEDPELAAEFRKRLMEDAEFAGSSRQRLQWFYRKTAYFDERWRLYPVGLEL
jgi:murein tripeptide amidase MpaA